MKPEALMFGLAAMFITALVVIGLALVSESEDEIPLPPVGSEYCVTQDGKGLGFCRAE